MQPYKIRKTLLLLKVFFRIKGGGVWPIIHWTPMKPLNIFFRSSNKFAAAEFDSCCRLLKRHCSLFCSCIHNFYTKQHLEPHIYCFICWEQFWFFFNKNKSVQKMFTFSHPQMYKTAGHPQ